MIALSLRLTLRGGREALGRLLVAALGVGLGVAMLLVTLAGINAVNSQNGRYAWLESGELHSPRIAGVDQVWFSLSPDLYRGTLIGRVDLAPTGPHAPVPPGLRRVPRPGEYFASPAMIRLLRSTPFDELRARYPGRLAGTIGSAALPSPDSLLIVVGRTAAQLAGRPTSSAISAYSTVSPGSCTGDCAFIGIDANGIALVLSVATAALLFPVLVFIGAATRLSAARREQRFAAMRLVGATPRQITVISTVESTLAAALGTVAGFAGFLALRPAVVRVPFTGARFFLGDLVLTVPEIVVAALGVPVAAAVAARLALRRVTISPLGVSRRITPAPPRAWRVVPLLLGLAELALFVGIGRPDSTDGQTAAYLTGILATLAGLVYAGPWLTMVGSRLLVRRAARPATLIAGRRLADDPKAGFRAVSGLVLALFVSAVAIAVLTAIDRHSAEPSDAPARGTLVQKFVNFGPRSMRTSVGSIPAGVVPQLRSIAGVTGVTVVRGDPHSPKFAAYGVVGCAALAHTPGLGRCAAHERVARVQVVFGSVAGSQTGVVWPAARYSAADLAHLPIQAVAVAGSPSAIERARTELDRFFPYETHPTTLAEDVAQRRSSQLTEQFRQLVEVVVLTSLPIAGCSLAVSIIAGIGERRRAFSLLRLAGTPLQVLRRVIAWESAVPLLLLAVVSIGTGFLAAGLFLRSQLQEPFAFPSLSYYLCVGGGLLFSLAIIATTLPFLRRTTGPEVARND